MKKILTAMTAMSMALQASENQEERLEFINQNTTNDPEISDILQSDDLNQSLLGSSIIKSLETNEETLGGSGSFMSVDKYVFLADDQDSSGSVTQGDVLVYQIDLRGPTQVTASNVVLYDVLDSNTSLIAGSVQVSFGTIIEGNGVTDTQVEVQFGSIGVNSNRSIEFFAFVNSIPSSEFIEISNQALATTSNLGDFISDNPFTVEFGDPTVITAFGPAVIFKTGFE